MALSLSKHKSQTKLVKVQRELIIPKNLSITHHLHPIFKFVAARAHLYHYLAIVQNAFSIFASLLYNHKSSFN